MSLVLDTKTTILVYGAAFMGTVISTTFQESGYSIKAYIDKRADEIESLNGKPVYSINEAITKYDPNTTVIFIAVKNVYEHSRIARLLEERGFTYIVFKPEAVLLGKGDESQLKLSKIYDTLCDGAFLETSLEPSSERSKVYVNDLMNPLYENEEGGVYYIPASYVAQDIDSPGGDIHAPITFLQPHIDFFRLLDGDNRGKQEGYLAVCEEAAAEKKQIKITDMWRMNVIDNRTEIFERMNTQLNIDPVSFAKNATRAKWNPRGFFNICSGKHRMAFCIVKKMFYVPLRLKRDDYGLFLHDVDRNGISIEKPKEYSLYNKESYYYKNSFFPVCDALNKCCYKTFGVNYLLDKRICLNYDHHELMEAFIKRYGGTIADIRDANIIVDEQDVGEYKATYV